MARFLIGTMPYAGHVRPLVPIAAELVDRGHEVTWYTGAKYRGPVEATGARFAAPAEGLDYDDEAIDEVFPDRIRKKPGLPRMKWDFHHVFIDPIPGYVLDLEAVGAVTRPDVLISDPAFFGGYVYSRRHGLPWVVAGISVIAAPSVDAAPFGLGLPPSTGALGRVRNRALNALVEHVIMGDVHRHADRVVRELGLPGLDRFLFEELFHAADLYLQTSVPEFEYPRRDLPASIRFVGAFLPGPPPDVVEPPWWHELDGDRPVVLVTQGTVATDPRNLIMPTLDALRDEDLLVVATTGGPPVDVVPASHRPANARIERFLPFDRLLPKVDVMVTNGGFGGIQFALANGVPIVAAGRTEEKVEVNARVAWSGVGIDLKVDVPTPRIVGDAVMRVLTDRSFRDRARALQASYDRHDAARESGDLLEGLVTGSPARVTGTG